MAMTEPGCGTDLKLMRTRAAQDADGTWRITGAKMFISGGDHDLAENIIHCLLAKTPDEQGRYPDELSRVQLFMVSKRRIDETTGALVGANGVSVGGLETKMGLHASATCALDLDGAVGHPIHPGAAAARLGGMAGMFEIMNDARLITAHNAIGLAEGACQAASAYAKERRASRAPGAAADADAAADPILAQPDVRRLLLSSRAFVEGARAVTAWAGLQMSRAAHAPDPAARRRAEEVLGLLTPVMKAYFTDRGFEAINACLQVLGGHGYIKDHPLEQFARDARALALYEGANGVQASDLALRRVPQGGGRAVEALLEDLQAMLDRGGDPPISDLREDLGETLAALRGALAWMGANADDAAACAAVAYDLLTLFGVTLVSFMWVRMAEASQRCGNAALAQRKLTLARLWFDREGPMAGALLGRIRSGRSVLMVLEADAF
jgi:alkylation response protein AidB-like acyl-CoA dehydrogenase